MGSIRLVSSVRRQTIELSDASTGVVGRSHDCDFPILDPSISRRHTEVSYQDGQARLRDLGSSNGTFVNGKRITDTRIVPGDNVTIGRLEFTVQEGTHQVPESPPVAAAAAETTIIRQVPVDELGNRQTAERPPATPSEGAGQDAREAQLLLIDIAKELARQENVERILERFVDLSFEIMKVDCASLMMLDPDTNELVPRVIRGRFGSGIEVRKVPTSISSRVVGQRIAILTDNAAADVRFGGSSIVVQSVRSAMCTPLMGRDGSVLGVFYVDNRTANRAFADEDLNFLISFAGIAAGVIEHAKSVKLSALERHLSPHVANALAARDAGEAFASTQQSITVLAAQLDGLGIDAALSPDERAGYLAHYIKETTKIVFSSNGTLDRAMTGDILAFWGLPIPDEDAAAKALTGAKEIQSLVDRLNKRWLSGGGQPITVRIGLATGNAIGQNIGTEKRPEYAVVGSPLDQARLFCALASPGEIRES